MKLPENLPHFDAVPREEALRLLCLRHCPEDMDRFDEVVRAWLPRTAVWKVHIDTAVGKANPGD